VNADQLTRWATAEPLLAVLPVGLLLLVLATTSYLIARRTGGSVFAAALGALVCTAYSGDTSWGFARDHLGMASRGERAFMFAAGEVALIVCGVMARTNKKSTASDAAAGTPGVPGMLVWVIAGVQVVPAFAESGFWAGIVRAFFGPIMAALLWHLAMGLEIRVHRPEALSTGLPAQIGHELRERLLSYLGLAVRGRTAEQVTRDRAMARTVRLASRRWLGPWGRAALKAAAARSGAAIDPVQRHKLLQLLATRRGAAELRTLPFLSPWVEQPLPEPHPPTPLGVTGAELRRMDPVDAVLTVHAAHPQAAPAELASLCTEYGVPVSETQVQVALHALPEPSTPPAPQRPAPTLFASVQHPETEYDEPSPDTQDMPAAAPTPRTYPLVPYLGTGLLFDLTTEPAIRSEVACAVPAEVTRRRPTRAEVHARIPDPIDVPETSVRYGGGAMEHLADILAEENATTTQSGPTPTRVGALPEPVPGQVGDALPNPEPVPGAASRAGTDDWERLLARARQVDAAHRSKHGRPASVQTLKTQLRIGQPKAQLVRDALSNGQAG
jgi:hypothetical protein